MTNPVFKVDFESIKGFYFSTAGAIFVCLVDGQKKEAVLGRVREAVRGGKIITDRREIRQLLAKRIPSEEILGQCLAQLMNGEIVAAIVEE